MDYGKGYADYMLDEQRLLILITCWQDIAQYIKKEVSTLD